MFDGSASELVNAASPGQKPLDQQRFTHPLPTKEEKLLEPEVEGICQ